jgi:hypothetical protein
MAPSFVTIDNTSDFDFTPAPVTQKQPIDSTTRTLLIAPPSISSHEERLRDILSSHDRSVTDLQMLDRLSLGLVTLPATTYDLILILTDADGTRSQSSSLLSRDVYTKLTASLKAGGKLQSQDGTFGQQTNGAEYTEAILAGLVPKGAEGMEKPDYSAGAAVPLRLNRKKKAPVETQNKTNGAVSDAGPAVATLKRKSVDITPNAPVKPATNGVGFVDFSDDFGEVITGEDDDDELIDEDTLLNDADLANMVVVPPECIPRVGKRRRACKDCTCGLAEKLAAEDTANRESADEKLKALKLDPNDLAEVDFTVQGKVGSCGNCSLGDAFRCDGCPYIGMPAFKPGEEVRLLNNDVQL